ncbi:MAG: hypothetical protein ABR913_03715 [Sedimentisphaerales bacterium]|jgi:hypothetical protein
MKFDKLVETIAGLGVPGLVLLFAMAITGYAGAAAITTALAALGGPLGMLGGIGLLILLALISRGITKWGFEKIAKDVLKKLIDKGETKETIIKKINEYWFISKDLKLKLIDFVEGFFRDKREPPGDEQTTIS